MSNIIKLEAFIASPPTSKCQETIDLLEDIVRRYPDDLRLVIFKRGTDFIPDEASMGMKTIIQKGSAVPAVVINGTFFSSCEVPGREELEERVQEVFERTGRK